MDHFCYGCMKEKQQSPCCEHCGFSEDTSNQPHQLPIGALLEHQYVIGRVLGQGGFGITYIGWDEALNRAVAIKEYFPAGVVTRDVSKSYNVRCVSDMELFVQGRERFLKEAQALARLQDLAEIAQVYNYFVSNGTAYIVMEYVEGIELKAYVQKKGGKLTAEETLQILKPLMTALEKIHKVGMIHRDLSPDNIMIKANGQIVLLDFGTARDVAKSEQPTQAILKPGFAPMEQYQSEGDLGPWTDEYALCATMYYCMTGHTPPEAPERLMDKVDVDWNTIPGLSRHEIKVLDKGMAFKVEDRYPTVAALSGELYKKPQKRGKKILAASLAAVVVAGAVSAAVLFFTPAGDSLLGRNGQGGDNAGEGESLSLETLSPAEEKKQSVGMLMEDSCLLTPEEDMPFAPAFGTEISRREVNRIIFLDGLDYMPEVYWDVSMEQNGRILAWVEDSAADPSALAAPEGDGDEAPVAPPERLYDLYIAADGYIEAPERSTRLFMGYTSLEEIQFNGVLRTSGTAHMNEMFHSCWNLKGMDLTGFDTSSVTNMDRMFLNCISLETLELSSFQTGAVTSMSGMFSGCAALSSLDITGFDTSSAVNMSKMFQDCASLTELDLTKLNTAKATDLSYLLEGCGKLKAVDVSGFNTASVSNMRWMFAECASLETLDLSNFNTSNTRNMRGMFNHCSGLTSLNVSSFNTAEVTDMSYLFAACKSLTELDITHFSTANVTNMYALFYECSGLRSLDVSNLDTGRVTDMRWMFSDCRSLESLDVTNFDTGNVTSMHCMFYECGMLKKLDVSGFNTEKVTAMGFMFGRCYSLEELNVSGFKTGNVTSVKKMFAECGKLPTQNLSKWDVGKVTDHSGFMDDGVTIRLKSGKKLVEKSWEALFEGGE